MENGKIKRKDERGVLLFLLVFFFLALFTLVMGTLCLQVTNNIIFSVLFGAANTLAYIVCAYFVLTGKEKLIKSFLTVYILVAVLLSIYFLLQKTGFFAVIKSEDALQEYLKKTGTWMPIFYVLLQFLQVIVLPIPSALSTFAGVALFGAFWTMIYSLLGILSGSFVAFLIGRKLGDRAVSWIVGRDNLKKWQKKLKGKDNLLLTVMFVLPLFPDDVLCFIAGLSSMTLKYFLTVVFFARFIGIAATCYSLDFIPFNTWWGILLWIGLALFMIFAFIFIYKNMEKIQKCFSHKKRKKL